MPQNPDYIPTKLSALGPWADNFRDLITANPTNYGLAAGDATDIGNVVTPFLAALTLSTNPATRTPVTVNATQAALDAMLTVCRPFAVQVSQNPLISGALKLGVGVTDRITTKTRNSVAAIGTITTSVLTLEGNPRFTTINSSTPLSKARPLGALSWEFQIEARNPPATAWEPFQTLTVSRPDFTLDRANYNSVFEYRYRTRWVGALLPGGAANVGPWSAWSEFMFLPS